MRLGRRRGRRWRPAPWRVGEQGRGPKLPVATVLAVVAGLAWAYVPAGTLAVAVPDVPRPPAAPGLPWLSTASGHIVDEQGRTVLLHGFNSDALLEDSVRHADLDTEDAALMQRSGFDVVRLPIAWSLLEPQRGHFDSAYLDRIDHMVTMLNAHGLYVVLDMHFLDWGPRFGGSGAPDWAALPLVPDLQWWPWESWRKHLSPAANAAVTYFWLAPDWQADFIAAWRAVAQRLRDRSGVAGYDLYNEPHPLPLPPRVFEQHFMWPLYARTIAALAPVDPLHLFIVEGVLFGNGGTTVVPLAARDLVYSSHLYTGALVPPAFTGDAGALRDRIAGQVAEAAAVPAPLWSGELGIDHAQAHAAQWADAALDAYDDAGAGWAWWQWRESPSWGIRDRAGGFVDWDFLRHLARPYVIAAPRGVQGGRGDGVTGMLRVHVDAAHGDAVVVLSWPLSTLGEPAVQGACVRDAAWDEATARLTVALRAGVDCEVLLSRAATGQPSGG